MTEKKDRLLTLQQSVVLKEFEDAYGIAPSQIGFDGDDSTPIFDYAAISYLSLRLTDIKDMSCWIVSRDSEMARATAKCDVTLPDGRSRSVEGSAAIGELLHDGNEIADWSLAESVAQSRASRLAIRAVGVNLLNAHKTFLETGRLTLSHTNNDPLAPFYAEAHVLAEKLGYITNGDKTDWRLLLKSMFLGKESTKDLDGRERDYLLITLRALDRIRRSREASAAAA